MVERVKAGSELQQKAGEEPMLSDMQATSSHISVHPLYTPADLAGWNQEQDVGYPGEYPFTRGVQPTVYRGRLWTMRQYAGMGDAEASDRKSTRLNSSHANSSYAVLR